MFMRLPSSLNVKRSSSRRAAVLLAKSTSESGAWHSANEARRGVAVRKEGMSASPLSEPVARAIHESVCAGAQMVQATRSRRRASLRLFPQNLLSDLAGDAARTGPDVKVLLRPSQDERASGSSATKPSAVASDLLFNGACPVRADGNRTKGNFSSRLFVLVSELHSF
jgi:hypothetical protein